MHVWHGLRRLRAAVLLAAVAATLAAAKHAAAAKHTAVATASLLRPLHRCGRGMQACLLGATRLSARRVPGGMPPRDYRVQRRLLVSSTRRRRRRRTAAVLHARRQCASSVRRRLGGLCVPRATLH